MADKGFGGRVFQARLEMAARRGTTISQREVGKALGVTGVTVGRWESGEKEPDLQTIARLALYLGVSPGWLAWGTEPQIRVDVSSVQAVPDPDENGIDGIEHPPQKPRRLGHDDVRGQHHGSVKKKPPPRS